MTMKWLTSSSVLLFLFFSLSLAEIPSCLGGCRDSNFCDSTCYTTSDNILFTVKFDRFGSGGPICTAGVGTCPADLNDFDFENCLPACQNDAECNAYIKDEDFTGPRCKFLLKCMDMEEANTNTPCYDCESKRKCRAEIEGGVSCPSFVYLPGSTVIHWDCEMQGDAYSSKPAEGTVCKPSASCDTVNKPASIKCKANEDDINADGSWVNAETGADLTPEELADSECACQDLRIPAAADTTLFCESEHAVDPNGDYIIKSGDKCDLVCDAQVSIPIECRFNTEKTATSWHIKINGDIDLGAETTCLACSSNNCDDAPPTGSPFNVYNNVSK